MLRVTGLQPQLWHAFLDLLFPPHCVSCQAYGNWLCQTCHNTITFTPTSVCDQCGSPVILPQTRCLHCQNSPLPNLNGIYAATVFEAGPIRAAIHALKYDHLPVMAEVLGQMLAEAYQRYQLHIDRVIPVPLHFTRFKERGYNQSELLAAKLCQSLNLTLDPVSLQRTRRTVAQVELTPQERRENVKAAFHCSNTTLTGQHILLIDDVYTTGSTLEACASALKQAQATAVWGLTVARAKHPQTDNT